MSEKDRKELGLKTSSERTVAYEAKMEKELQRQCEQYLMNNGYFPRTSTSIEALPELIKQGEFKGWYIHLYKTKKNPLLLDLLILHDSGVWIEIELKMKGSKIQKHQQTILDSERVLHRLAFSLEGFIEILKEDGFVKSTAWIDRKVKTD